MRQVDVRREGVWCAEGLLSYQAARQLGDTTTAAFDKRGDGASHSWIRFYTTNFHGISVLSPISRNLSVWMEQPVHSSVDSLILTESFNRGSVNHGCWAVS